MNRFIANVLVTLFALCSYAIAQNKIDVPTAYGFGFTTLEDKSWCDKGKVFRGTGTVLVCEGKNKNESAFRILVLHKPMPIANYILQVNDWYSGGRNRYHIQEQRSRDFKERFGGVDFEIHQRFLLLDGGQTGEREVVFFRATLPNDSLLIGQMYGWELPAMNRSTYPNQNKHSIVADVRALLRSFVTIRE